MRICKTLGGKDHIQPFFISDNLFCNILVSSSRPFPEYLGVRELKSILGNSHIVVWRLFWNSFLFRKFLLLIYPSLFLRNCFLLVFFFWSSGIVQKAFDKFLPFSYWKTVFMSFLKISITKLHVLEPSWFQFLQKYGLLCPCPWYLKFGPVGLTALMTWTNYLISLSFICKIRLLD